MPLQANQVRKAMDRYYKYLAVWAVVVREPKALKSAKIQLKSRNGQLAVQQLLTLAQYVLGKAQSAYKTKQFFAGSAEARKLLLKQLLEGKADWSDLKRNLSPAAPKFVKYLVKHGERLNRYLKNPNKAVQELQAFTKIFYETITKLGKVRNAIKPKAILNVIEEILGLFYDPELTVKDIVDETPPKVRKQLVEDLQLEVPPAILNAFRKAVKGKVGRFDLRKDVLDQEGVLVLTLNPEDIKFTKTYVVFYHPKLRLKAFQKMTPQRAARLAEKMAATTVNLAALLTDLKKDYKNLYGAALRTRWAVLPVEDDKVKELPILNTHKQSAVEIIEQITNELKEAHGEVERVKTLLQKGETIYLENEQGEYEKATVVKVNKDGSVVVRVGRKRRTLNPLEDHYLTEEEYKKLTRKGGTEELTPEEIEALKELGIEIE